MITGPVVAGTFTAGMNEYRRFFDFQKYRVGLLNVNVMSPYLRFSYALLRAVARPPK